MSRQVLILGGLLGLALVSSYLSWTSEEGTDADDTIVVLDGKAEDLASVVYTAEKLTVALEVLGDERGSYVWVTTTEQKRKAAPKKSHDDDLEEPEMEPGHPTEAPTEAPTEEPPAEGEGSPDEATETPEEPEEAVPEEPEYEDKVLSFKAGTSGDDLLETLAPFVAERLLPGIGPDRYEDYGLTEPVATLVVTRDGKDPKTYQVGGEAYGTRDLYMLDESGQVYLIDKNLLRPLKYAPSRMPDRELLGVEMGDVTTLRIQSPSAGVRELEHRNRADPKNSFFAAAGAEEQDEVVRTWLDKALALKSAGYVQPDQQPTDLQTAFELTLTTADGPTTLVVSSGTNTDGENTWYASSEHTRDNLVELHSAQASEASIDLDAVFDAEEEPPEDEALPQDDE